VLSCETPRPDGEIRAWHSRTAAAAEAAVLDIV
jgi:hypothetical protein